MEERTIKLDPDIDSAELDKAIEKINQLTELLREASSLINSLVTDQKQEAAMGKKQAPKVATAYCQHHGREMNDVYIRRRGCLTRGKPVCKHLR